MDMFRRAFEQRRQTFHKLIAVYQDGAPLSSDEKERIPEVFVEPDLPTPQTAAELGEQADIYRDRLRQLGNHR